MVAAQFHWSEMVHRTESPGKPTPPMPFVPPSTIQHGVGCFGRTLCPLPSLARTFLQSTPRTSQLPARLPPPPPERVQPAPFETSTFFQPAPFSNQCGTDPPPPEGPVTLFCNVAEFLCYESSLPIFGLFFFALTKLAPDPPMARGRSVHQLAWCTTPS